ncbi:MAG: YheV family putative zinc ribbon protein [Endozoicomonas sp.]
MTIKRFIAGVVCPSCGAQDTIRMYRQDNDVEVRECVECGFSDVMENEPSLVGKIPETRISHDDERQDNAMKDEGVQIVRILGGTTRH